MCVFTSTVQEEDTLLAGRMAACIWMTKWVAYQVKANKMSPYIFEVVLNFYFLLSHKFMSLNFSVYYGPEKEYCNVAALYAAACSTV
jgi:hypothetical protein